MDIQYPDAAIVHLCVNANNGMGLGKIRRSRPNFNSGTGYRIDRKFIAGIYRHLFCNHELAAFILEKKKRPESRFPPTLFYTPKSLYGDIDSVTAAL